ncbi:hypothetical protein CAPTEDRAFT_188225 [Capitella teleta]|uniref:Uncharacterized protein n=1 Tax=Capitella teleta TaxID=283909 RepID=R7TKX9_CAPTE|nr:hypothetical protein CAPTEDRAFT_188225 [Capitella teleta]|eukprot:ELT92216.1 hypothetical protein CAPTEDRAFT_188225 [Capitella teleta]
MNRLLIALCVFGLVAVAFAKPSGGRGGPQKEKAGPGGQKGGKGGREGGRGADLVCEVTSDTFSMTRVCVEGECSLGPRLSVDRDGNQVSTKFCDAVNENGTSLVAKAACLITDMEGNVLFVRTLPDCDKPDDVDRPVVECNVEMEVLFENEVAKAFFPNGTKGGHRGGRRGHFSEESSEEDSSEESDEDDDVTVIIEALMNNPEGAEEAAEPRRGDSDGKKKGNKRGARRGDSSEESSEEKSNEEDVDVAESDDDEVAPEAIVAGQKGGKGRKPSKRRH